MSKAASLSTAYSPDDVEIELVPAKPQTPEEFFGDFLCAESALIVLPQQIAEDNIKSGAQLAQYLADQLCGHAKFEISDHLFAQLRDILGSSKSIKSMLSTEHERARRAVALSTPGDR